MKKVFSLVLGIVLCLCLCSATAETTFEAKEVEAYSLELNPKAGTLMVTDRETRMKHVADLDLNPLSEDYSYLDDEGNCYVVAQEDDLKRGLLDGQGKPLIPMEYADFDIISDRWIAAIKLVQATSDNYDYKTLFGETNFYLIDAVDIYYRGEKKGTLTRSEWKSANGYGDYLLIRDRDGNSSFYNKDFVKSDAEASYSGEYSEDYSTKTITHLGSNQPAFVPGCLLTPEEVWQSVWINRENQLIDLQGNVIADFSGYAYARVDDESGLIKLENANRKYGLADATGKELIPCKYDSLTYNLTNAMTTGYAYAERDGKGGFVNLATGAETGFVFTTDAGKERAAFILVDDPREGKILISAAAGELPGRYKETQAPFPNDTDSYMLAVVQEQDDTCHIIGQLGEDVLPGVTFKRIYDATFSNDGKIILLKTGDRQYTIYKVNYDPDLSAVPAPAAAVEEETWTCENGHSGLTGNFCNICGAKKPE